MTSLPGWLVTVLVLLPNLLMFFAPPVDVPRSASRPSRLERLLGAVERVGQVGCFAVPILSGPLALRGQPIALGVAVTSLAVYYFCWARYLFGGRRFSLLFQPLNVLPLPLAVAPVIYFAAVAILLRSWLLGISATAFAVGHVYVSSRSLLAVGGSQGSGLGTGE